MKLPIYLDYSSTTPVDVRVANKMMKYLTIDGIFGNSSSRSHCYGWQAEEAVEISRKHIANLINTDCKEIIFTSGATESINLAIKGIAFSKHNIKGKHIITGMTEHKAVLNTCKQLEIKGFNITRLMPNKDGIITPKQLRNAIQKDTILVSLMHVNNETGVIQNIEKFGEICHTHNILFHVDATQSIGKIPVNLKKLLIDLMSFSAHKMYGPKGIGVLFINQKSVINIETQIHGGGHENGIRSGTLAVHQIVGIGEACRIAKNEQINEMLKLKILRNQLWNGLKQINNISINGSIESSISTILNIEFLNLDGNLLILALANLAVSIGSACISSNNVYYSHVLKAMGLNNKSANSSIRFSLGRFTTKEEIEYTIQTIKNAIIKLRKKIF